MLLANSYAYGAGVTAGALPQSTATFFVKLRDSYGNKIVSVVQQTPSVTISGLTGFTSGINVPSVTWSASALAYVVQYTVPALASSSTPGTFSMSVQYSGSLLPTSNPNGLSYTIPSATGAPTPGSSYLADASQQPIVLTSELGSTAGSTVQFYVQLADANGFLVKSDSFGGTNYAAQVTFSLEPTPSTPAVLSTGGTGLLGLSFAATRTGTYSLLVQMAGTTIAGGAVDIVVAAGPPFAASAKLFQRGGTQPLSAALPLSQAAGAAGYVHVASYDAYGEFISPCSFSLSGALCGPQLRRDVDIANDRARGGQWLGLF